jgi:hypothetical protein
MSHAGAFGYGNSSSSEPKKTRQQIQQEIDALQAELDALPYVPLGTIEFSTYLHDNDMSFDPRNYLEGSWAKISPEDQKKLDARWDAVVEHFEDEREKPFYEIELRCSLNLDTFEIKILRLVG